MLRIVVVILHFFCPINTITEIRLVITRYTRLDGQYRRVFLLIYMEKIRRIWTRPDKTHRTVKYVQKLRNLVNTCLTHQSPDLCYTRIIITIIRIPIFHANIRRIHDHRTEFIHSKHLSTFAYSLGLIEDGTLVRTINDWSKHTNEDYHKGQSQQADGNIHQPFSKKFIHKRF